MSVNTYRILSIMILLIFIASILPHAAAAAPQTKEPDVEIWRAKFHPALIKKVEGLSDDTYVTAIIMLKPLPSDIRAAVKGNHYLAVKALKEWAKATQEPVVREINKGHGMVLNRFWLGNMLLVKAPLKTLKAVAADSFVVRVIENFKVTLIEPTAKHRVEAKQEVESWGIFKIRAPDAWSLGYLGDDIRICVLDTGVDISHEALAGKMLTLDPSSPYYPGGWMEWDENGNPVLSQPHDTHGHGTHTSGTALGGDTENILIGVAPHATLMHGLVLPGGGGTFAQVTAGMEWTVDPYYLDPDTGSPVPTGLPAHVVSMSWGATGYYSELLQPIKDMLLANVIPVAAIGNDGPGSSSTPGNIWGVFGVGATDQNDQPAYFSSGELVNWPNPPSDWPFFGEYPASYIKPDFSAPGVGITSAVPGGGYESWDGTSMATPHVSGTVALILQAAGWTDFNIEDLPEMVYTILNESAVDLGDPGQDDRYGWGRIDAYEAVQIAQQYAKKTGVEGWVRDAETGEGIAWARVTVVEVNKTVNVNASGYFRIPLDPGNYTLVIEAWGYESQTIPVVVLPPGNGTVVGHVYDATTLEPIVGASVFVQELNVTVTTDATGYYEISLPEGTYHLIVTAPGYHEDTATVEVTSNETTVQDFYLMPMLNGTIMGFVYDLTTEEPIEGATVVALPLNATATTDLTGYYELTVPPGTYTLVAYASGYQPGIANVTVGEGEVVEQDFGLVPAGNGSIYGYVYNESGYPIPGAVVTVVELGVSNVTDASGYYMVKDIPAGIYTVEASAEGYVKSVKTVLVLPNEWVVVNFTLSKVMPVIALVGDTEDSPDPNMTDIQYLLVSVGFTVEKFDTWEDLYDAIINGSTYAAIIVNKWYGNNSAEAILTFLQTVDDANIPLIILDTWTSSGTLMALMHNHADEIAPAGYPVPLTRERHYPDPDEVTVKMLDTSHPIFSGVVPDIPPDEFYPATLDSYEIDYAAYDEWSTNVTILANLIDTANNVNLSTIVEWTAPGGEKWVIIGYGASYWIRYTNNQDYGMFSNNSALVLINAVTYVSGIAPTSLGVKGGVSSSAYTEVNVYLNRLPYGWVTGQVVDEDGNPIAGAKVTVIGTPVSVTTGDDGSFTFWLPVGTYTITISAFGYYTKALNVTVSEGETVDLGQIPLEKMPMAAILYDYQGQIADFLNYIGILGVDYDSLDQMLSDLQGGGFDLVIWSGHYRASMPPQDQVDQLLEIINEQALPLILLDQWGNYGYGINTFHTYYGDPANRGYGYGDGIVQIRVDQSHPIFYGYEPGDVIQIFTSSSEDYSYFGGFSGISIGSLLVSGDYKGDAIAYKILDSGAKIILMAPFAPESYTPMSHWTEDAFTIFANAVFWAMLKPLSVSLEPTSGHVGDTVTVTVSGDVDAGTQVYVYFDDIYLMTLTIGSDGTATGTFTVPLVPGGVHSVSAVTADGLSYGMATFTVLPMIVVSPTEVTAPGAIDVVATGLMVGQAVDIYLELNWLSSVVANESGVVAGKLLIPLLATGTYNLRLVSGGTELYSTPITVYSKLDNLTVVANVSVDLSEVIDMLGGIDAKIDVVNNKLDTISSSVSDILNDLSNIRGVLTTISGDTATIKTSIGEVKVKLDELNASLAGLIETKSGDIYALLDTKAGQVLARLDTVVNNLDSLGVKSDQLLAMLQQLGTNMTTYYNNIMSKLDEISSSVSQLSSNLQDLSSTVDQLSTKVDEAKTTAEDAKSSVGSTASISYAATGLSVIALLAALAMFFRKP